MRVLWRVSRPLYAAAAAAAQAAVSSSSSVLVRGAASRQSLVASRQFVVTATRWQSTTATNANAAAAAGNAAEKIAEQAAAASTAASDDNEPPVAELKDVGAETTKVLTIADVLMHREAQLAQQGTAAKYFDQWESIPGSHTIQDAIDMMVESNIGSLIVTEENGGIVGIVTERDVLKKTSPRALTEDTEKPVKDIMSDQIMCIPSTTTVIDALATMTKENIRHLAVINGSEIQNAVKRGSVPEEAMRCVLSIKDIVKAYAQYEAEKKQAPKDQQPQSTDGASQAEGTTPASAEATTSAADKTTPPPASEAPTAEAAAVPATPIVTAATLLKKKHKKIKLILNTRADDNVTVAEAVDEMARHNFGAVLVVDKEQRVHGIFTERDYLTKVLYPKEDTSRMRVVDVASKKVACFQIEDSLEKCWTQAAALDFRHFPVVGTMRKDREKELAGVLSIKDIVREISKGYETPSGFRLFEFFKSKMAKDETPAPPAAAPSPPPVAPAETVAAPAESEKTVHEQETPEKQAIAAKIAATEATIKKPE